MSAYQPKTGQRCHCKPGIERDNCGDCEGTGWRIDFAKIRVRWVKSPTQPGYKFPQPIERTTQHMKPKLTMSLLAILAALALSDTGTAQLGPGMTQVKTKKQHQVVILWAYQGGYGTNDGSGYVYRYNGAQVYVSSSSPGAPTFPQASPQVYVQLTELADALAMLLNDGFTITKQSDNGLTYTLIKN